MRTLIAILILIGLFGCSDRKTKNSDIQKNDTSENESYFDILIINAEFPLRLNEINLEEKSNIIHVNDGIVFKIEETIKEYAKDIEFYDSSKTYKDTYINTIRLPDSLLTVYLILLKHYPTGVVNSRVLFYNNEKKEFADSVFDFNLWALYDFNNGKLIPTSLKTDLKITSPEIELIDFNKDGINDYKFVRLYHNGTANAIHTTILNVRNMTIDTLYSSEKWLDKN